MGGATGSGQGMQTGRTNRAEGRTILWAQVPPGQSNFNGPAILIVEVAKDADDPDDYDEGESFIPSNPFDGIVATGWSGGSASNFGGTPGAGAGVIGNGGRNQGTGVIGFGSGTKEPGSGNGGGGGIGVHGIGGSQPAFFVDPNTPPGVGVVGQGGVPIPPEGPVAAGVIGLAGGTTPIPEIAETGNSGVYGAGPTGVFGHGPIGVRGQGDSGPGIHGVGNGADSRGGQFESTRSAQVQLVPHTMREPTPPTASVTPQAIVVDREGGLQLPKDGRGGDLLTLMDEQRQCTLWFCVQEGNGGPARWAQVLVGSSFDGQA